MFLRKVTIDKYKILEDISIDFNSQGKDRVFPVAALNGGGKSTLLQFIFVFLHCPFRENRIQYIQNLLENTNLSLDGKMVRLVEFEIEHNEQIINLEFHICNKNYNNLNFDSILDVKELKSKRVQNTQSLESLTLLRKLEIDIQNSNISDALIKRELRRFVSSAKEEEKLMVGRLSKIEYLDMVNSFKRKIESDIISDNDLDLLLVKAETEQNKLFETLQGDKFQYALHFKSKQNVLLYKSNAERSLLDEISDRVYLASPNTQVLHFLKDEQLSSLFNKDTYLYSSYDYYIKTIQKDLIGLFTYDFSAVESIMDAFKKARDEDFQKALDTGGAYGSEIKKTIEEFSILFSGKTITVDKNFKSVSFKTTGSGMVLNPKDLSHGELKKLSIFIWLKAKILNNSVILMDEVDSGLHPTWQYDIPTDLQKWSVGSQFILATHSPQIISNAYYKNLIILNPASDKTNKTTVKQFAEAPLDSDLNTIVKTIMGGEYIPKELGELRKKYREYFDKNEINSKEAKKIKEKMLEYESENSSFFQEINFELELKK
ncbi:MAG: AAA family ATPase [Leptospiraceae bacterium]|nr:AAA family ATPase [Leptospiraceae bacterium]